MSDTVFIPPEKAVRRRTAFIPPLLILSFIVYNVIGLLFFGGSPAGWENVLFGVGMVSGQTWFVTAGDLMIGVSLILLFLEILKSTRAASASVMEHMLSVGVFVLFLVEFLLFGVAASSVFFLLMLMALIDVVAGFTVSITSAGRDVTMG